MSSAIIVMTLLGCAQGDMACDYIRTLDTPFESRAACEAQTQTELLKTVTDNYPEVVAICAPPRRETTTAAVSDLPAPSATQQTAPGEPKVIRMPEEARPKNPFLWTVDTTRRIVGGVRKVVTSAWNGLTGKNRRNDDPIVLGQFVSTDL